MRPWVDQLRGCGVGSVTAFDLATLDGVGDAHHVRFARFSVDRVRLAYADVEQERHRDVWDLRLFGQPGRRRLDFTAIRQPWLREATKAWTAATAGRVGEQTLRHRVGSVAVLSAVLAAGARGGADPTVLTRADAERFLARIQDPGFPQSGRPFGARARVAAVQECALMLREARQLGLLPTLGATFAFRSGDARRKMARWSARARGGRCPRTSSTSSTPSLTCSPPCRDASARPAGPPWARSVSRPAR